MAETEPYVSIVRAISVRCQVSGKALAAGITASLVDQEPAASAVPLTTTAGPTWRVQFVLVKTNCLGAIFVPTRRLRDAPDLLGGGSRSSLQRLPLCHLPDAPDLLGGGSRSSLPAFPPQHLARNVTIPRTSRGHSDAGWGRRRSVARNVTIPRASRGHSGIQLGERNWARRQTPNRAKTR